MLVIEGLPIKGKSTEVNRSGESSKVVERIRLDGRYSEISNRFRRAIDAAKANGKFDKDFSFNRFPRGCCGDASDLLGEYLLEKNIQSIYVCDNRYFDDPEEGIQLHAWLLVDGMIADITGDQFIIIMTSRIIMVRRTASTGYSMWKIEMFVRQFIL